MPDDDLSVVLSEPEHDLQVVHSEPVTPKASTRSNASRAIGAGLESLNPIPLLKTIGGLAVPPALYPEPAMKSLEEIGGSVLPWVGNPTPYGPQHPVLNVLHGVPFAGPPIAQIGSELSQGQYPEAGGHTAGLAAQILLGKLFGDIVANPEARMPMPPMPSAGTVISAIRHPIRTAVVSGLKGILGEEPEAVKAPPAPKPPPSPVWKTPSNPVTPPEPPPVVNKPAPVTWRTSSNPVTQPEPPVPKPGPSPVWRSSTAGGAPKAEQTPATPSPVETGPPGTPSLDDIASSPSLGLKGKKFSELNKDQQAIVKDIRDQMIARGFSIQQGNTAIRLTPESATPNVPENAMTQGPPALRNEPLTEGQKAAQRLTKGKETAGDIHALQSQNKNFSFAQYLLDEQHYTPEQVQTGLSDSDIAQHFPAVSKIRMAKGEIKQPMKTPETSGKIGRDWPELRNQLADAMREIQAQRAGKNFYE